MAQWRRRSTTEQFFEFLRGELLRGRWGGTVPGVHRLAAEFGINRKNAEGALQLLEDEGLLEAQGPGRRRRITLPKEGTAMRPLQVAILAGEASILSRGFQVELRHELIEAGHTAFYAPKFMLELGMDMKRIARMVHHTEADAWIVNAGPRPVLEWFAEQELPSFALFGRRHRIAIPGVGPNKGPAIVDATRRLIELGHRRIVLVVRRRRRLPEPGADEAAFLEELSTHGISSGAYNLPDWEENNDSFHECLESLFRFTPPTAMIMDEVPLFFAAQQFLMDRGLRVPQDVSLLCNDFNPDFDWCRPSVAHIHWDSRPVVRRVVRWAANIAQGKEDRRQTFTKASFVEGGTIGPAADAG